MNIENTLNHAVKVLSKFNIKSPILDSEILLSKAILDYLFTIELIQIYNILL